MHDQNGTPCINILPTQTHVFFRNLGTLKSAKYLEHRGSYKERVYLPEVKIAAKNLYSLLCKI